MNVLKAVHTVANRIEPKQKSAFMRSSRALQEQVDLTALEKALAAGDVSAAMKAVPSLKEIRDSMSDMEDLQEEAFFAGTEVGEKEVNE